MHRARQQVHPAELGLGEHPLLTPGFTSASPSSGEGLSVSITDWALGTTVSDRTPHTVHSHTPCLSVSVTDWALGTTVAHSTSHSALPHTVHLPLGALLIWRAPCVAQVSDGYPPLPLPHLPHR